MITSSDELEEYRTRLETEDEEERVAVYREISDLGILSGNEMLVSGLSDSSARVRMVVIQLLVEIADEAVIENLMELVRKEEPGPRSHAMTVLSRLEASAVDRIAGYLSDDDPDVRIFTANILGNGGHREAFGALEKALHDPEENVRYAVVEALGKIGSEASIPLLLDLLPDEWARYPAVESLGLLKAGEAVPYLLKLYETDEWVRFAVIEALGRIGDPGQVDFLIDAMNTDNEMILNGALVALARIEQAAPSGIFDRLREKGIDLDAVIRSALSVHSSETRIPAIWAIGAIGSEGHLPLLLVQLADFDERIKSSARQALVKLGARHFDILSDAYAVQEDEIKITLMEVFGEIGNQKATGIVIQALEEGHDVIREAAAKALALLGDRTAVAPLTEGLTDRNPNLRKACAWSLGVLRAVSATRYLLPLLEDPYVDVRESASEALGKIGTMEVITHVTPLLKHARMEVRQAAIQCLGLIMNPRVNGSLIDGLGNADRGVRRFAANILGKRKISQALKPLMTALLDEDWQVRKSAASALGNLNDHRAFDMLFDSLNDENIWVRNAAVLALGKIGDERVVPRLLELMKRDIGPVRIAAMEVLHGMKVPELYPILDSFHEDPDEEIRKAANEIKNR